MVKVGMLPKLVSLLQDPGKTLQDGVKKRCLYRRLSYVYSKVNIQLYFYSSLVSINFHVQATKTQFHVSYTICLWMTRLIIISDSSFFP